MISLLDSVTIPAVGGYLTFIVGGSATIIPSGFRPKSQVNLSWLRVNISGLYKDVVIGVDSMGGISLYTTDGSNFSPDTNPVELTLSPFTGCYTFLT